MYWLLYRCCRMFGTLLWLSMCGGLYSLLVIAVRLLVPTYRPYLCAPMVPTEWLRGSGLAFCVGLVGVLVAVEACGWSPRARGLGGNGRCQLVRWDIWETAVDWFERHGVRTVERRRAAQRRDGHSADTPSKSREGR